MANAATSRQLLADRMVQTGEKLIDIEPGPAASTADLVRSSEIYDCLVTNSNDATLKLSVGRFRRYPAMPSPFFTNRRFHSEIQGRMETLARVDPSAMVYLAGCSERKVSVADAIYLMGDGDKASWAINPYVKQMTILLAPRGTASPRRVVDNVAVICVAKERMPSPIRHIPRPIPRSDGGVISLSVEDDRLMSVTTTVPGIPLEAGTFKRIGRDSLTVWAGREERFKRRHRHASQSEEVGKENELF
ncbi:MAG: hypothetical protein LQ339_000369 [Xanthoria mediterranea]|nr:MAG: hypothetical protein LQ339_000369 [Xanthoria mediterranea]